MWNKSVGPGPGTVMSGPSIEHAGCTQWVECCSMPPGRSLSIVNELSCHASMAWQSSLDMSLNASQNIVLGLFCAEHHINLIFLVSLRQEAMMIEDIHSHRIEGQTLRQEAVSYRHGSMEMSLMMADSEMATQNTHEQIELFKSEQLDIRRRECLTWRPPPVSVVESSLRSQ